MLSVGLCGSLPTKMNLYSIKNKFWRVTFDFDSVKKQLDKYLEHINHL